MADDEFWKDDAERLDAIATERRPGPRMPKSSGGAVPDVCPENVRKLSVERRTQPVTMSVKGSNWPLIAGAFVAVMIAAVGVFAFFNRPAITLAEFESLTHGMSEGESAAVVGASGSTVFDWDFPAFANLKARQKTVVLQWVNPDGSNGVAAFENGKLIGKTQIGLK